MTFNGTDKNLGEITDDDYVIDPTFDWGTGKRIGDDDLLHIINHKIDLIKFLSKIDKKKDGYLGKFCIVNTNY